MFNGGLLPQITISFARQRTISSETKPRNLLIPATKPFSAILYWLNFGKDPNTTNYKRPISFNFITYSMIRLSKVDKFIDSRFQRIFILKNINLTINEGEFVTLMGPSGAGKSTILNIIGLLDEDYEGDYTFENQVINKMKEKHRNALHKSEFGYIFQAYHLIDELTVYENIETPLLYRGVASSERKSIIAELLDRFKMVAKKDLFPAQLSGGQQQLVGIARAVAGKPRILLADEPTGNLHSTQAKEIMEVFKELHQEGTTIIQATHSAENASYGSRLIEIVDGKIGKDTAL